MIFYLIYIFKALDKVAAAFPAISLTSGCEASSLSLITNGNKSLSKGLTSLEAAKRILNAIKSKKREAVIAKWNDIAWLAVYIRKFSPSLYFFLARRIVA